MEENHEERRKFLQSASVAAATIALGALPRMAFSEEKEEGEEDVTPAEDLMREHGGLNRILLIYEEGLSRIRAKKDEKLEVIRKSASIIRDFIEGYHEKLEEEFLFPRLKKAKLHVALVDTLLAQHAAGRKVTDRILALARDSTLKADSDRAKLMESLQEFVRMYRPHESREDTIIFPDLHRVFTKKEYDKLGDQFEDREHKLFGKEGFEGVVAKIGELEKEYGIDDISKFTPKA